MSNKISALQDLINCRFKSEAEFARALNWSRQRLNKITNGTKIPNVYEVKSIADGLNVSVGIVAGFFLSVKSPNRPHNNQQAG